MTFKKGAEWNGNKNGRPKGSYTSLTSVLKAKLNEIPEGQKESYKDMFIKSLIHKALVEKDMQSMKLIMNYVDGLPKQEIVAEMDGTLTIKWED